MTEIRELSLLEDIENLSEEYRREFGELPINLSTWDPSPQVLDGIEPRPPSIRGANWVDYSFSYEVQEREGLLEKFGFDKSSFGGLITHSGSTAIVSVVNWFRAIKCSRILILAPRYFSVPHALSALGIAYNLVHLRRTASGYQLPEISTVLLESSDALWITNPVYCTSVDFNDGAVARLQEIVRRHQLTCVIDECLADPGRYISAKLADFGPVVGIYAPHKAVCVNGLKFGFVAFPKEHQRHFDTWSDVWSGCLPASSVLAFQHFLSPDFERYRQDFKTKIAATHDHLRAIVETSKGLSLDVSARGYLVSVYAPRYPCDYGANQAFLRDAMWNSGASFIAGVRNELDPRAGLSFRINLSAFDSAAAGAFARLCEWLSADRSA